MPSLAELRRQKLAEQKAEVKVDEEPITFLKKAIEKKPKKSKKPFLDTLEPDKMTMDEVRAYYIIICKKKPKHNSIQTKNYLINEIMEILKQSKKEMK